MAYNENKLTALKDLKLLAQRVKDDFATKASMAELSARVDDIVSTGGEPNVITSVKVNGSALPIADKAVDVPVPTKVSQLTNDAKYQTDVEVAAAVAEAAHLKRKILNSVDEIDSSAAGAESYIYMVPKGAGVDGDQYDEYMIVDGKVEKVGNTEVDLTGYVQKEAGKGLSSNDFTDSDKAKLDGVSEGANKVTATAGSGTISIDGTDVVLFEMATNEEVAELLNEVFGAPAVSP